MYFDTCKILIYQSKYLLSPTWKSFWLWWRHSGRWCIFTPASTPLSNLPTATAILLTTRMPSLWGFPGYSDRDQLLFLLKSFQKQFFHSNAIKWNQKQWLKNRITWLKWLTALGTTVLAITLIAVLEDTQWNHLGILRAVYKPPPDVECSPANRTESIHLIAAECVTDHWDYLLST